MRFCGDGWNITSQALFLSIALFFALQSCINQAHWHIFTRYCSKHVETKKRKIAKTQHIWSYREHCWGNRPQSYTDHRDLPSVPSLNSNLRPPTLQAWLRCALSTMKITIRVHDLDISFYMIKAKANEHSGLLRGRSRQRKPLYATGLSICLSVCVLPSCVQKRDFLKKNNQSRATVSIHDL